MGAGELFVPEKLAGLELRKSRLCTFHLKFDGVAALGTFEDDSVCLAHTLFYRFPAALSKAGDSDCVLKWRKPRQDLWLALRARLC